MAWGYIADKRQIGLALTSDELTTKYVIPGTYCEWIKSHSVIWIMWISYPGACSILEEPLSGLLRLDTADFKLYHNPVTLFSLPVNMSFCLVLLEFLFAGLTGLMSTQASHSVKQKVIFDNLGSYFYYSSTWIFWLAV